MRKAVAGYPCPDRERLLDLRDKLVKVLKGKALPTIH
jgi:hypothetical protein